MNRHAIEQAAEAIGNAHSILITAGAGIGVDSGLPDFRGDEGFWKAYPPFKERGLSFYDLANPVWFRTDPQQAWGFYGHRLKLYRDTTPNPGFDLLLKWAQSMKNHFVFTSNVDMQFQRAGFAEEVILECHGSFSHLQCSVPCTPTLWNGDKQKIDVDHVTFKAAAPLPECPHCQSVARPNILMFGDAGWISDHSDQQLVRYRHFLNNISSDEPTAVIEIGAGTAVPSVRYQSETQSQRLGAPLVRINPREAQGPNNTISIESTGLEALKQIDQLIS